MNKHKYSSRQLTIAIVTAGITRPHCIKVVLILICEVQNIKSNLYVKQNFSAEPLKKKKKMDPAIIKAREERRRKKLEKQIRRLQKNARQLKPIDELEVPLNLLDQIGYVQGKAL